MPERIIVARALAPCRELIFDIGRGLPGKRRVGGIAFARRAVAARAGGKTARGIADMIKAFPVEVRRSLRPGRCGKRRVEGCYLAPVLLGQPQRDRPHRFMFAPSVRIIVELAVEVTRVEAREPRAGFAIAFAFEAVAGETGGGGPAIAAAHRDRLARRAKGVAI